MKSKQALSIAVVALLVFAGTAAYLVVGRAYGQSTSVSLKTISLPAGSTSAGVVNVGSSAYQCSNTYGACYAINATTMTSYSYLVANTTVSNSHRFFAMVYDSSHSNLGVTRRNVGNDGTPMGISTVAVSNGALTDILDISGPGGSETDGLILLGSYYYTASQSTFYKVLSSSPYTTTTYSISGGGGAYYGFASDSSSNVWFTDLLDGKLCKFPTLNATPTITCYDGSGGSPSHTFSRPLGLAVSGTTGYAAENNANGYIDTVDLTTGKITAQTATSGTPWGMEVVAGNPIWGSSGSDHQICILSGNCKTTNEDNFFLSQDASANIYFGGLGSNVVGQVSGLVTTQTSTFTSATYSCSGGGSWDASYNSVCNGTLTVTYPVTSSSSTSTSSSSTSTSSTTSTGSLSNPSGTTMFPLYSGHATRAGEKFTTGSSMIGKTVSTLVIRMALNQGSPSGTITATLRDSSGNVALTFGTASVSTLTGSFADITFTGGGSAVIQNGYRALVEYSGGDLSDNIGVAYGSVTIDSGATYMTVYSGSSYGDFTGANTVFTIS